MNNFEPKKIKKASQYLEEKLKLFTKEKDEEINIYKIEDKKSSPFKKFVNLIFRT